MTIQDILALTEDQAREHIEKIRWPDGPVCPHCKGTVAVKLQGKSTRPGVYKCKTKECRKQFTVMVGSIFSDSHISLRIWLAAFNLMCASKKGISAHQIHRMLGVTYKSAWFLCHRIRFAMKQQPLAGMLTGIVEADECYIGGKPRKGTGPHRRGTFGTEKTPVMVLVERNGKAVSHPLERVHHANMKKEVEAVVANDAILMTDEGPWYKGIRDDGTHRTVNHHRGEYGRTDPDGVNVTSNSAESFIALLKRGHYGTFHQMSKKHLHRYCDEFAFRWTNRKIDDGERTDAAIEGAEGKRLQYKGPTGMTA